MIILGRHEKETTPSLRRVFPKHKGKKSREKKKY